MANLEQNVKDMLKVVAGIEDFPDTAFNVRVNGECAGRENSNNIEISPKENGSGIDITVKANTKGETVYIPVVVETSGMKDLVYNDFYIGENADVKIIAGCGIHNDGHDTAQHDGIHTFHLEKNSKVLYEEKHYGEGGGTGDRVLNPETIINLKEGSYLEMETVQIEGVDSTNRITKGQLEKDAKLIVKERLMTSGKQWAKTDFVIDLDGEGSSADLISRSVAKDDSKQEFISKISGNNECAGHSECDAIIMDDAVVTAIPEITANHVDASLIHEAAIGKIAGEQITKLMTLGLSYEEAEREIVNGFLK